MKLMFWKHDTVENDAEDKEKERLDRLKEMATKRREMSQRVQDALTEVIESGRAVKGSDDG